MSNEWRHDDPAAEELAEDLAEMGRTEGKQLRITRDATAEDLEEFMPGKSLEEREAFVRDMRDKGCELTVSVVKTI